MQLFLFAVKDHRYREGGGGGGGGGGGDGYFDSIGDMLHLTLNMSP